MSKIPDEELPDADTLEDAIRIAVMSEDVRGKRKSHQRRIPGPVLRALYLRLMARIDALRLVRSFAELHELIVAETRHVHGAGELLAYDVALRIGLYLGLPPKDVYLHAGTRKGARKFGITGEAIPVIQFPQELHHLGADGIESFLCAFAKKIAQR